MGLDLRRGILIHADFEPLGNAVAVFTSGYHFLFKSNLGHCDGHSVLHVVTRFISYACVLRSLLEIYQSDILTPLPLLEK